MAVVVVDCLSFFTVFIKLIVIIVSTSHRTEACSLGITVSGNISWIYIDSNGLFDKFVRPTVQPCSSVYCASPVLLWARASSGVPFRPRQHRSMLSSLLAYMLLTIAPNPGPQSSVRFGSLNIGSAGDKGAAMQDLIRDHRLEVLAVSETWIRDGVSNAIKFDMVPPNFAVLHAHRPRVAGASQAKRGGGLALIHSTILPARAIKTNFCPGSFELQLIGLQVGNVLVKVASIYRPPSSSKSTFMVEFAELLTSIGLGENERLVICGDFNLPGDDDASIDSRFLAVLDVHCYHQHVTEPT
jgi:hypothetical protein